MFSPGFCIRISAAFLVCFLLLQLHLSFYIKDKSGPNLTSAAVKILEIYSRVTHAINREGYMDKTQSYKIIPIHRVKNKISSFDVTCVSQCSWNRFYLLENLLDAWEGPTSIAVFADVKFLDEVLWSLSVAVYCHRFKELDLSLVLPAQGIYIPRRSYLMEVTKKLNDSELCKTRLSSNYGNTRNYDWSTPYPVNLLRNIARSRVESDYILVIDIDMIPSRNLRKNFLKYVWSRKMHPRKIVFVVPVFEVNSGNQIPKSKSEVASESLKENVRPFYFLPCKKCQLLTNYTKWFSYPNLPGVRTLYKVDWKHPWEPFFISYRDAPNYDERFKQYGYNRVSQKRLENERRTECVGRISPVLGLCRKKVLNSAKLDLVAWSNVITMVSYLIAVTERLRGASEICQLHMEGYSFLVLDSAFLIHQGFKSMDFHETKNEEMVSNRRLYENFKLELKMKYPNSNRTCDG